MDSSRWRGRLRHDVTALLARALGQPGRLPDFLCLGAQRAGTTTLHHLLANHPDIHVPADKELHYFTLHADRPLSWYVRKFRGARHDQLTGESTPYYLYHQAVPRRVATALSGVRLLVLLRDPVQRALSGYFHSRRLGLESLPLEAAIAAEQERLGGAEAVIATPGGHHPAHQHHSYVDRSRYEVQLARWLAHVPRGQMLLLRSEDLFAAPSLAWERVQRFLQLPVQALAVQPVARNAGDGEDQRVSSAIRRDLRDRLAPTYEVLGREFGIRWNDGPGYG